MIQVFAGPISESVPTGITGFASRRARTDSITSFTYYPEDSTPEDTLYPDDEADEEHVEEEEDIDVLEDDNSDIEAGYGTSVQRKSSSYSRRSVDNPLLGRSESAKDPKTSAGDRTSQKIYILNEDLTIVVTGFKTSTSGFLVYILFCCITAGIGYLVLRWLPRWKVRILGITCPLGIAEWVVIENQWAEFTLHNVKAQNYGHPVSTVFGSQEKNEHDHYEEDLDPEVDVLRSIDYRYIHFIYHTVDDKFAISGTFKDPSWTSIKTLKNGINEDDRTLRSQVFGQNVIDIEQKSILQLLMDEVLHPFYIFQVASMILWSFDEYYYYAACIFLISIVSVTATLIDTRTTMKRLRDISRFECNVRVLRDGFWRTIESSELVPGDVYELSDPSLGLFPCDSLLLAGDCIVNESMLTGESVPVSKTPATDEALELMDLGATSIHPNLTKHFLFSGTKIVRARRPQSHEGEEAVALGMAVRTGFNTTKGALVRSMLFPKPSGFKFYRDSFRYISVMGGIAGIGFIASFINFMRLGLEWHLILVRALDLVTIVVPPALPATLTIGTNFAISRLKGKQIFCISPQRVNVGGKLDIICFDKTGTLTEDGLDVLGLRIVHKSSMRFSDLYTSAMDLLPGAVYERDPTLDYSLHKAALYTMATCHSLRIIDDNLVGDPLDFKMFDFTGWQFEEGGEYKGVGEAEGQSSLSPSIARPPAGLEFEIQAQDGSTSKDPIELGVLRSFEFISQLRRASVLVRHFGGQGADVYVKGAPECMKDICQPTSFPIDYEDLLSYYTHRGFRVIAIATKHIPKLSWIKAQRLERATAESDLEFIGFIIFENKLKEATTNTIDQLNEANIRSVMCTGDNILTAISVARECHLINKSSHCFVPRFAEGDSLDPKATLEWHSIDNPIYELDSKTLLPKPPPSESDLSIPHEMYNVRNHSLAVTGDVFRWIVEYGSPELLKRMLAIGQVFARMSPDEKHELVEKMQSIDYCCGFCGDGANDCGALKAADVGISLSEAEASVAAPFTSRIFDISCVPEVIREGRAALVTSFCCFKYMSLYSAIQFTSVSFLYASASNLGDLQFLFIDLLLILPIAIFMGWTGAYPGSLSRKRPTASLVSRKVLTPLLGQIAICITIQAVGFKLVQQQPWYIPPKLNTSKSNIRNSQNTTLFLISCFQYILSSIVLSIGPPFRKSMRENLPFVVTVVSASAISLYLLLDASESVMGLMDLTFVSWPFKGVIVLLAAAGFGVAYVAERSFFVWLARGLGKVVGFVAPVSRKKRKEYKVLIESLRY